MNDQDRQPYDRQPGESEPAWQAFVAFRDRGPGRTVAEVGRKLGKSVNLMDRWCQRWDWRARARAWDAALDRRRQADLADQRRSATDDALAAGEALIDRATRLITPPDGADPEAWTPDLRALGAAAAALDKGITLQRLALGLPTSVTRQDATLREEAERVGGMVETIMGVLEEHLCHDCRAVILDQLQRLARADD